MDQIRTAIRYFLSDGKEHIPTEVKAEILRLIGQEVMPGEVNQIYAELHRDTIMELGGITPNGTKKSVVKLIG